MSFRDIRKLKNTKIFNFFLKFIIPIKMTWVEFLKKWASDKKMSYRDAMKDPKVKVAWAKEKKKMGKM
jgi:hypothetical protein